MGPQTQQAAGWAVIVVPPDLTWPRQYDAIAGPITVALGPNLIALHHIGSTSVPGLAAKPILDLLAEVRSLVALDVNPVAQLGFEHMGEFGIPGRRYFRRDSPKGTRTHHLHAFATNDPHLTRHLHFRDYLRAHPAIAQQYADLKRSLAQAHPHDREAYQDGKDPFIQRVDAAAFEWAKLTRP